ncbi:RagB/SusD family nutrient uptake outer membrane protein [Pseudoflavitalea sp. G-6-1-2]|uniref:RagB/SusD family nutrient uptake outer membrane protein n=1 Tax=Pseudoflavitalea sp. G-6-1-2 TaxID=2728841 RepID=UPI00146E682A|nr:RagB/SusD family nutrient uptake outer membrane protein [Pseudoflavitalea sp. G-6-1-2]NML23334.1 RagB/SusD family nutrient uptake outer membrane protein [Pseudoflavitalea sp. G-6-1-2]
MFRNIHKIVACVVVAATITSCKKDFLEITPKGKLIASTVSDYNLLLSNLDLLNMSAGSGLAQVIMGDEVAAAAPYFAGADLRTQRLFRWDDVIYQPTEIATEMKVFMENLYTYNKIIHEIDDATGGSEEQKKSIKAEALASRAWTYFSLINYYGKPYDAATAASDPGYPIITVADVTESKFTRASVKEVYDFIVSDLQAAIPQLPAKTTHRLRMSKATGEALLGKVWMFMGKFDAAEPLLAAALTGIANAEISVQLYDYNVTFGPNGEFMPVGFFGPNYPTAPNIKENLFAKQFMNNWTFTNSELVLHPQAVALYKPSDLRLNFYSTQPFPSGDDYKGGALRKMGPISAQFGITVPDIYLLLAECKARNNDLSGAVTTTETLRKNRMPAQDVAIPANIATNKISLVKFILEERIREFAMQGYRWFDMRRLSVDPDYKNTVKYTHTLFDEAGNASSFTLRPERLVMRLPQLIITQNPGMQNNP